MFIYILILFETFTKNKQTKKTGFTMTMEN